MGLLLDNIGTGSTLVKVADDDEPVGQRPVTGAVQLGQAITSSAMCGICGKAPYRWRWLGETSTGSTSEMASIPIAVKQQQQPIRRPAISPHQHPVGKNICAGGCWRRSGALLSVALFSLVSVFVSSSFFRLVRRRRRLRYVNILVCVCVCVSVCKCAVVGFFQRRIGNVDHTDPWLTLINGVVAIGGDGNLKTQGGLRARLESATFFPFSCFRFSLTVMQRPTAGNPVRLHTTHPVPLRDGLCVLDKRRPNDRPTFNWPTLLLGL